MLKSSFRLLCDLCLCERICSSAHSRWIVFIALSWKVRTAALNTSHETQLCVQHRGFHRKKCRICPSVTSGSPLPCHVILNFPPLCSSPCCWRVQWKMPESVEQMPLFLPHHGARGFWAGGLVSCVEATVDPVLMDQRFHCLVFWSLLNHSMKLCWRLYKCYIDRREHWRESTFEGPYSCEISSPVQLLRSSEEGGQRWLTDGERKSRSRPVNAMETYDL